MDVHLLVKMKFVEIVLFKHHLEKCVMMEIRSIKMDVMNCANQNTVGTRSCNHD